MKSGQNKALELLIEQKKMDVTDLADAVGVSKVTMRKYLNELEQTGIIQREHGFAVLANADDVTGRLAYHYDEKRRIAHEAALLVEDGDAVMIESGSCCALLALALAETKKDLTIVTNSVYIAQSLRRRQTGFTIVLTGGIYQEGSECMVGPMVREGARSYNVRLFFIGADGWSERGGFTNKDQLRAQAVRDMAESAERVVVVTESEKFSTRGVVPMHLHGSMTVVTDDAIPAAARSALTGVGTTLRIAEKSPRNDSL